MNQNNYAVQVENLTVAYDVSPVLWNVNLSLPKGNLIAIIGPNGAGKTTLIKSMLGLIKPISGEIRFGGIEQSGFKNKISYVPQSESVDWDFPATALDVVMMGRYGHLGWLKRPKSSDRIMALEMLEKMGMRDYANRQISQLSGGQQQRVFLARALVQQADLYLMDEPFKGVDAQTEKSIVALLQELKSQGKTVIVVHHDLQTVSDYFDWVCLINLRVVANGPVAEVFDEKNLGAAYGGKGLLSKGAV